jgi:hypothetical protein
VNNGKKSEAEDIPVSASDFVPSRLLIDQLCISIFQIYSTENIMIKYICFFFFQKIHEVKKWTSIPIIFKVHHQTKIKKKIIQS